MWLDRKINRRRFIWLSVTAMACATVGFIMFSRNRVQVVMLVATQEEAPYDVDISMDSKRLAYIDDAAGSDGKEQTLWVVGVPNAQVELHLPAVGRNCALDYDGSRVAVPNPQGSEINVWEIATQTCVARLKVRNLTKADGIAIGSLAFDRRGSIFAVEGVWDLGSERDSPPYRALAWQRRGNGYAETPMVLNGDQSRDVLGLAVADVGAETRVALSYNRPGVDIIRMTYFDDGPCRLTKEGFIDCKANLEMTMSGDGRTILLMGVYQAWSFRLTGKHWLKGCVCNSSASDEILDELDRARIVGLNFLKLSHDGSVAIRIDRPRSVVYQVADCKDLLGLPGAAGSVAISADGRFVAQGHQHRIGVYGVP